MLEKIAEILTKAKIPILKDPLKLACGLSSITFNEYITQLLLPCGLLDAYPALNIRSHGRPLKGMTTWPNHMPGPRSRHRMIYQTSRKGFEYLKYFDELMISLQVPTGQHLNFITPRTIKRHNNESYKTS